MAKTTGSEAPGNDDFEAAFAQFSAPDEGAGAGGEAAPAAAAAAGDASGAAAAGGKSDGSGSGDAAAAAGEPGGAADAGSGDGGAAPAAGAEGADAAAAAAAGDDAGAKAPEAGAEGAGAGEGGAATGGEAQPAAAAPASEAVPSADDVLARLGELVAKAKPGAEAPAAETKPEVKPPFTDEEAAQIQQYDKDWPDVAKGEALKRRGEYQELLGFVFAEVQKYVQPLMETLDALAGRAHLADVKAAVPDYSDNLRQQVVDWVGKQPAYLQKAYTHVIESGTHDEVKDLVERYRQATGQAAPAAGAATTGGQGGKPAKDNELSGAAKEAAAALAPVESKRSEVIQPGDPSNFDDAWSQFSKDLA